MSTPVPHIMNEETKNESHSHGWLVITVAIGVPLLYLLSFGPAVAAIGKHPRFFHAFQDIYFPLIWLHDHTALRKPLEFYVRLWVAHP